MKEEVSLYNTITGLFKTPLIVLSPRQEEGINLMRRFLYDADTVIWMTPDGERILEKYDVFHRLDQAPEISVYLQDNAERACTMIIVNHEFQYIEQYDETTWKLLIEEIDNEIRKRRQHKIELINANVVAGMKRIKPE
jgi:hypothetical protein